MDNNKYLNYYVEILTNTMTDAVIRNISLQANARVTEDVINDQVKKIEELNNSLESIKTGKNQEIDSKINNFENSVKGHLDTINHLNVQLAELNKMKSEYENVKHQVQHVNVFRDELNKERELHQKTRLHFENQIKELNGQIEYLQLTPAKRKKLEEENKVVEVLEESSVLPIIDDTTKDGGSF
jgi:FtsZ-binding cell division protein ZapB